MTASSEVNPGEAQARRLESVYEQLNTLLLQPEVVQRFRTAPGENEWSALQVLGHMTEMIPYWLSHCRTVIGAAEPPHFGRTLDAPERLAAVDPAALRDPVELMRLLGIEVRNAARTIRQFSPAERQKKGIHIRQGVMTVDDMLERFILTHAQDHLAQVQTALQT
jgi:hypothetical protein